jgi:hypothetical protein
MRKIIWTLIVIQITLIIAALAHMGGEHKGELWFSIVANVFFICLNLNTLYQDRRGV